ncbi:syntaxin 1B/2/3 [Sporothrix schenckii 1099-18]|uniref:Syntaxin 1B/2/3 n=1 Tax=Sporothrix schenckii 1099-18 TaxID=1397361 RepID=A0A0F2LYV5_SPOSC|nr:syntaxin 1B/2/3 [Sporothrix schenckii 1099-18]KJR82643.1 syntaxin 1B/2/3 [Sporothrix schenckii 1099-18]
MGKGMAATAVLRAHHRKQRSAKALAPGVELDLATIKPLRWGVTTTERFSKPAGGNVEMASLAQNAGSFAASGDPNAILNECRSIDRGIDQIDQNLNQLRMLQDRSLNEADSSGSSTSKQLDALASDTMALYRQLTERVRQVKSQREAQQPKNAPQVGRVDRRLKQAIQSYQQVESAFRKKTQDQMARQYRIVRPDASESEVRAVVEDTAAGSQMFQQAMMQSDRRGQARAVLSAVQDRHAALQKIEQQMVELAQLFQDMDTLIVQQEVNVMQIEQKAEEAVVNIDKGNEEIAVAVTTARKTRKKKWICLGICVIIVVVYVLINKQGSSKKRSIGGRALDFANDRSVAHVYELASAVARTSLSGRYVINTDFTKDDTAS